MTSNRYISESTDVSALAQPLQFQFSGTVAANRFLKASTTERISTWSSGNLSACGIPSPSLINVYKKWGEGQYGVLLTGNIMIADDHLEAPGNLTIPDDACFESMDERAQGYQALASEAKAFGSLIIGQLNHPGRQTRRDLQPKTLSASAIPLEDTLGMQFGTPHAATEQEIVQLIERFTHSAEYLHKAGFDGVQLHVAHGYLLAQFLSKSTNTRTDKYGGSFQNRTRLILEILESIRKKVPPSFILSVKVNSVEFQDGGFPTDEAATLCSLLERHGRLDFVELSGGTYQSLAFKHMRETTKKREAFFADFADKIAPALDKTAVYITGGFRTAAGMVEALKTVDGVGLARAACQEPLLCRDILNKKITGVIKSLLDQQNFMLTNVAAGTQIGQIGQGYDPIDLSNQQVVDVFLERMAEWIQMLQGDVDLKMHGFIDPY